MNNRICLKCVSSNRHISKDCNRDKLQREICQQKHATILHDPTRHEKKDIGRANSACSQVCGQNQPARSCARIVLLEVFHQDNPSVKVPTYAVLDDQSTDPFVTDTLLEQLGVKAYQSSICLLSRYNSSQSRRHCNTRSSQVLEAFRRSDSSHTSPSWYRDWNINWS